MLLSDITINLALLNRVLACIATLIFLNVRARMSVTCDRRDQSATN